MKHKSVFLCGFRATGKSTIGEILSKRLGWRLIEMDREIIRREGQTIDEITKHGTDWQSFRELEHQLLIELINLEQVIVSTGGGLVVNELYGELNLNLLKNQKNLLLVLLTASVNKLRERLRIDEEKIIETVRPVLNPKRAQKVQTLLKKFKDDSKKQKSILVENIVKDSLETYRKRRPLYQKIGGLVFDTGKYSASQVVDKILWKDEIK